jgi:hypothetical protein
MPLYLRLVAGLFGGTGGFNCRSAKYDEDFVRTQRSPAAVQRTFMADADQTRAVTSAFFFVEGESMLWLWLGIGLGCYL